MKAPMLKIGDVEINSWEKFNENDDLTLEQFKEKWSKKFNTELSMILMGTTMLYCDFMPCKILDKTMTQIVNEKLNVDITKNIVEVIISSDEIEDLPSINLQVKNKITSNVLNNSI